MTTSDEPDDPFVNELLFETHVEKGELLWEALLGQRDQLDRLIALNALSIDDLKDIVIAFLRREGEV